MTKKQIIKLLKKRLQKGLDVDCLVLYAPEIENIANEILALQKTVKIQKGINDIYPNCKIVIYNDENYCASCGAKIEWI